ncbi:hemicentin-1-like [Mytilus californianus]|uniref:hemicentin-1-like n=1 Tax=Mytilus californianus TaxID=6549 RepID=UPI002245F3A4|nr:hemicentin-1-like [Mytilus californianus]
MNEIETIYASTGSDVKIKCPNEKVTIWQYSDSKDVLAECRNGQNSVNLNLNVSDRLNVTSDCKLLIHNLTIDDLGTYLCVAINDVSYAIHVNLRKLKVDGANNLGVLHGTEGENITLACTVIGFLPGDTLHWITEKKLLASGNTQSLEYVLQAHRSYNLKEFTCITENSKETYPLEAGVQLNLFLKPAVSITISINYSVRKKERIVNVKQGQHMELQCREKDNATVNVDIFSWLFNGNAFQNATKSVLYNKIKPERSGQYTCMASNKAGEDSDTVNITVTCSPPSVIYIYSWKTGVISSAAVVGCLLFLYGLKESMEHKAI